MEPQQKKMLMIGGGIGGALLLSCCCLGGGFALWWFVLKGPGDVDKVLIGKWQIEIEDPSDKITGGEKEFAADGTFIDSGVKGTWKKLSKKDNTATIEIEAPGVKRTFEITPLTSNRLDVKEGQRNKKWKRV
jgi:hypothetical protein